ncbi:WD repeat-containing protein slp1 [Talaromyces islandicus]|uniref:Transcription initiation factor IIA large subunit n=1 Tax=Talaromyces islandicus TaxID=28573 RepID=A0A0U1M1N2_TALIS|nr:WD repeat-containing protein slp1 [Talaromyces islandicus]
MATASVSTPLKNQRSIFSTRTAGGRVPLTPSPRTRATSNASISSSPFTPSRDIDDIGRGNHQSVYSGNLFGKAGATKSRGYRESPKSNIARSRKSPKHLELGISDWTLTGTGPSSHTPSKERARKEAARPRASKHVTSKPATSKTTIRIPHTAGDRFIPNRMASEGLTTAGAAKPDDNQRPRTGGSDGSAVLASAASAFEIGGRGSDDDLTAALDNLALDDNESSSTYSRPAPDAVAYESSLADACGVKFNQRILAYKPPPPESSKPIDLRAQYNRPLKPSAAQSAQSRRRVQTAPDRVLDAPGLLDDYYLNLLDWSSGNQVAIGLERNVYVWSADSGSVNCLLETSPDTYVSSVKWSGDGAYVGIGLGTGEVQIWDVEEGTKLRSMYGHDTRVGVMGWSKHTLSTGARSGLVFNHDVRIAQHKVAELVSHTSEVCGLEWRSDGAQLATGGNDNLVNIWDARSLSAPKFTKTNHRAAVKALSWCPWQLNLLATGGGSYDRHIHFWNTTTGARTNSIDTGSQVTSLRWSNHYREIVSSSGFPDNSLSIWSYPTLVRHVEIPAHETRVLHSSLSPDGQMLATAAADESLKFWKLFERKPGTAASASREGGVGTVGGFKTAMSNQQVGTVYDRVIQDVCEASQVDFEEGGVDQQTLEEMRASWQQKLSHLAVAHFPWDPPLQPTPPPAQQQPANPILPPTATVPSNAPRPPPPQQQQQLPPSTLPPQSAIPGPVTNNAHANPSPSPVIKTEPGLNGQHSLPPPAAAPQGLSNAQALARERAMSNLHSKYGAAAAGSVSQLQAQSQAAALSLPGQQRPSNGQLPNNGVQDVKPPQPLQGIAPPQRAPYNPTQTDGASDGASDPLVEWKAEVARRREAAQRNNSEADRLLFEKLKFDSLRLEGGGLMLPLDEHSASNGVGSAVKREPGSLAQYDGVDDEDDEDAINSDLDDPDDLAAEDPEGDDAVGQVMLCTYDKVQRVKNKWKCTLKDGILSTGGKEYVFHKGQGEFEW